MKIFLVRHGETKWNKTGKMQGWGDSPLSELGKNQANWLSEKMKDVNIDKVYVSPVGRTRETARIIIGQRNLEIVESDSIKEINVGEWEGLEKEILEQKYEKQISDFWNAPHEYSPTKNGESFFEVRERVYNGIMEIVNDKENKDKTILIISHGIAIRSFLSKLECKEIKDFWDEPLVGQTSVTEIDFVDGNYEIISKGDVSHYKIEVKN